uniref:Uncharacterized protein n=1 Tax=Arundo donax TaxID=35708 RepID=A0A0A9A2P8_ARUDO
MQSAGFKNLMFPVWAIVLVSLRSSLGYLSRYSIMDRERRLTEVSNVIKSIGAGVLNGTSGLEFARPLWSLWAILQLRSMYRYFAHRRAVKSLWHGRSSEFLAEYLHTSEDNHHDQKNDFDYSQKYLIYGESNKQINIKRPRYVLDLDNDHMTLITLDKIWKCSKPLLSSSNSCKFKDMTLAFSLSRLLRCKLEDVPLHSESIPRTRHLITSGIIGDQHAESDAEAVRAFRILELELAFVKDYFYTFYPMVFWRGLFSLSLILLQSIATFAIAFWLALDIRKVYNLPEEEDYVVLRVRGCNVDVVITWVFLFFMMFKEVWEMVTYLLSNWTGLLLVCKYVRNQRWCLGNAGLTKNLTSSFFTSKVADPWHGRIDQHEFLQSCTYKPTFWKLVHTVTLGVTPDKSDGKIPGDAIKIPECVKAAVLQELRRLDLTGQHVHRDSLNRFVRYEWALLKLHTCSQVILVWHIATSLCEVKLAQDNHIDLSKPGCSVWSYLRKMGSCSSQTFLVDKNILQQGRLQTNYVTANSLSRYCAYLQVFQSELLQDSFCVPKVIFEKTLQYACEKLKGCDTTQSRYDTLKAIGKEAVQDSEHGKLSMNIVQQGAILANDLIEHEDEENRWEILAGVWAGLLVHIAPSWNAEAHKSKIQSGGEFITLLWALLWHCGIEKSSLWHEDNVSESKAQAPQEESTETRNTPFAEEQKAKEGVIENCEDQRQTTLVQIQRRKPKGGVKN